MCLVQRREWVGLSCGQKWGNFVIPKLLLKNASRHLPRHRIRGKKANAPVETWQERGERPGPEQRAHRAKKASGFGVQGSPDRSSLLARLMVITQSRCLYSRHRAFELQDTFTALCAFVPLNNTSPVLHPLGTAILLPVFLALAFSDSTFKWNHIGFVFV